MPEEDKFENFIKQYSDDQKQNEKDRRHTLAYVLWGFAVSVGSIAIVQTGAAHVVDIVFTIGFLVLGFFALNGTVK